MMKNETLMPVHPGEILREDFMKPLHLSVNKLALELHGPTARIAEIVHQRRRITADTALRLARYFHTNAEFWLNLQNFYDLEVSRRSAVASDIERQVTGARIHWFVSQKYDGAARRCCTRRRQKQLASRLSIRYFFSAAGPATALW